MAVQKRTIGRVPVNRGNYEEGQKYYEMNIVQMFGSSFISKVNDNTTPPAREENGTIIVNKDKWDVFADSTHAESAAKKADKAAENANATNDKVTKAEEARELNEKNRESSFSELKTNSEQATLSANEAAVKANNAAENANATNTKINEAEDKRVAAESARVTEFATLKQESQTATNAANDAAKKATDAATTIDDKINPIIENDRLQNEKLATLSNRVSVLEDFSEVVYGVEMNRGQADPNFQTWIGKEEYKESHPILSDFKAAKVKDGKIIGFLRTTDWTKMIDGTDSNIIIDGSSVVDDNSDVMWVNDKGFYAILGGKDETYERYLFSYHPFAYKGEEAEYVEPFGMTPDFSVIKGGVQRSIRDNTTAGSKGAGSFGITAYNENGYPTTSTSRFNYELMARKKNTDPNSNIPYANAFQRDLRIWCALLFVKFQTKNFHSENICGRGISCNDASVSEPTWGTKTGVRTRTSAETPWTYKNTDWGTWTAINGNKPLLKMFDCQLALSYASENKILENVSFEFDGATWKYKNITGQRGILDGEMTGIVFKFLYSPDGNTEVCLSQPIVNGSIPFYGNIWRWISGIEVILNHETNKGTIYQTDDIKALTIDTNASDIENTASYPFEGIYHVVGERTLSSGWSAKDFKESLMSEVGGGSLHERECHYAYFANNGGANKKARRGVLFGGNANADCSSRCGHAGSAPSYSDLHIGGGFRVSLTKTQA